MTSETKDLVRELIGTTCRCGATKASKNTFCRKCFYNLPRERRDALYRLMGEGYEQAYQAASDYLDRRANDEIAF
jgi:ribosomal protein L40E